MDKQVQLAMAKWPNVPHCYGWLGLDARGAWRMRDQQAKAANSLGSKITNAALRGFIARNYQADEQGRYFFQNGPQRVYVELQSTPYIAHSDPQHGWVLHTGDVLKKCDVVWMTNDGSVVLQSDAVLAKIDDRDMVDALNCIHLNGQKISDQELLTWLGDHNGQLTFLFNEKVIPLRPTSLNELAKTHPFITHPQP